LVSLATKSGEHQTLFIYADVGLHVTSMSLSHPYFDVFTLIFSDMVSNEVGLPLNERVQKVVVMVIGDCTKYCI